MPANHIKMIAMDIDGTLVDVGSRVSEENARAIAEAAARGIEIVLVTGRRFEFARAIAEQVPCDLCMINSNGAVIKSKSGESRLTHLLDAGAACWKRPPNIAAAQPFFSTGPGSGK
jgi:hydroxymethylpyrimidine pyrophosphatase-like HAD family hydrolase